MLRFSFVFLALLLPQQEATEAEKRNYVEKNVDKAIERGLRTIRETQLPSGRFQTSHPHGVTALSLYTFLALGGTLEDPAAAKALDWLLNNPIDWNGHVRTGTYQISLIAVALSYSIPHLVKGEQRNQAVSMLQRAADWLVSAQAPGGGWSYSLKTSGWHDHSNSQFAVLGLRAAANAGAKVKREVWEREFTHYKTSQLADGGWGYRACYSPRARLNQSTSTMTAAGVMGLAMAIGSLRSVRPEQMSADPAIRKGLEAMKDQWTQGLKHNLKELGGEPYLLYSVERACMVTGQRRLGTIDWYVEGAWLILKQQNPDGWLGQGGSDPLASHCFSLLFLKRAFVPVATPSRPKPQDTPTGKPAPPPSSDASDDKPREME
jgi:hypothetical protein